MDKILLSPQDLHDAVSAVLFDIITIRRAVSSEDWEDIKEEILNFVEYTDEEFEDEFSGYECEEEDTTSVFPEPIAEIAGMFGAYNCESWVDECDHTTHVYRFVINDCGDDVERCERRLLADGFKPEIAGSLSGTQAEFTIADSMENEPESKPDTRAERRKATAHKVNQRESLMHSLGKKAGSLYNKRRQKIDRSAGYMRNGNVSRYAETKPTQKTNNRKGYGKSRNLSRRDVRYMAMTDFEEE